MQLSRIVLLVETQACRNKLQVHIRICFGGSATLNVMANVKTDTVRNKIITSPLQIRQRTLNGLYPTVVKIREADQPIETETQIPFNSLSTSKSCNITTDPNFTIVFQKNNQSLKSRYHKSIDKMNPLMDAAKKQTREHLDVRNGCTKQELLKFAIMLGCIIVVGLVFCTIIIRIHADKKEYDVRHGRKSCKKGKRKLCKGRNQLFPRRKLSEVPYICGVRRPHSCIVSTTESENIPLELLPMETTILEENDNEYSNNEITSIEVEMHQPATDIFSLSWVCLKCTFVNKGSDNLWWICQVPKIRKPIEILDDYDSIIQSSNYPNSPSFADRPKILTIGENADNPKSIEILL